MQYFAGMLRGKHQTKKSSSIGSRGKDHVLIHMKRIKIDGLVAQTIAQVAVFQLLQSLFNLHPRAMANKIKEMAFARQVDPDFLVSKLHRQTREVFKVSLEETLRILKGEQAQFSTQQLGDIHEIQKYFEVAPKELAEKITAKAKAEELDPVLVVEYLVTVMPDLLLWAFSQTLKIVEQEQ